MWNVIVRSNQNLEARLRIPKPNVSRKAIVIAHSFRNNMNEPACYDAEKAFFENGYSVLSFNFLGHGRSGGRLRDLSYERAAENVSSAIDYMKQKGFHKIGVYAISLGTIAAVLSKEKPTSQAFLSPTPLYHPKGLFERYKSSIKMSDLQSKGYSLAMSGSGRGSFEIGIDWVREMQSTNGMKLKIHHELKVPTLILQGTEDPSYNPARIKDFLENFSTQNTYREIPKADHNFTNEEHRKTAIEKALKWFDETLA